MRTPHGILFLTLTVATILPSARLAAQSSNIATVPVNYSIEFATSSGAANVRYHVQFVGGDLWYYGSTLQTSPRDVLVEPGRPHDMVIEAYGDYYDEWNEWVTGGPIDFTFSVIASTSADVVYFDGIARGYAGSGYGYTWLTAAVGPEGGCATCGPGSDYSFTTDETRLAWSVKLGKSVDGSVIDPVSLHSSAVTNATFSRNELNFTASTTDVERVPASGPLGQILLPAALMDVEDITGGFELRFYVRAAKGNKVNGEYQVLGSYSPYVTYRFVSGDPGNDNTTTASFARIASTTETISLQRNLSTGRWTEYDPLLGREETVKVSDTVETTTWWNADNTKAKEVQRTYAVTINGQRELVSDLVVPNHTPPAGEPPPQQRETVWWYLGDTGYPGSKGKLNMRHDADGSYTIYTYWNEAGPAVGRVARVYRPYNHAPDGWNHGEPLLQTGRWSEYYWAEDINGVGNLLAERVDRQGSTTVGRETGSHSTGGYRNGRLLQTSTYTRYAVASSSLSTTIVSYAPSNENDVLVHGKVDSLINPDRTMVSYIHQRGTWSEGSSTFTADGAGLAWREVEIRGSADAQSGATQMSSHLGQEIAPIHVSPDVSTATLRIRDQGNVVREELWICISGTTFEKATEFRREYASTGALKKETRVDSVTDEQGVLYDSGWSNERLQWERDARGVKRTFTYDGKGRVQTVETEGIAGRSDGLQHSQTETAVYDAADQVVQVTVQGGSGGTLVSKTKYDLGGLVIESEVPGGRKTNHTYAVDGGGYWAVTTIHPDGAKVVRRFARDGRLVDETGSAVVASTHGHSIDPDGRESHSRTPYLQHQRTDWLGRTDTVSAYRPDDENTFESLTSMAYNGLGQLEWISKTGAAVQRFAQVAHLNWQASALDIDGTGGITYDGTDPITTSESYFTKDGSNWWLVRESGAYDEDNSSAWQHGTSEETQLCGFTGSELSRTRTRDINGQVTTSTTTFDWAATEKKLVTTTDLPTTTENEIVTVRNGRLSSVTSAQGLTTNVCYDQFGREIGRQHPRTGLWTNREFAAGSNDVWREQSEVDYAAGRYTATYEYDTAGRVSRVVNAHNKDVRYAYNTRGQLEYQWGSAAQPVSYQYDANGRQWKMHTYRGGSGWDGATWPSNPETADTTEWVYSGNTGLLKEKRDARYAQDNSRRVSFTYYADGLLYTREWARTVPVGLPYAGQRVKTTYNYDAARRPTGRTYNDGTLPVTIDAYNRRGQPGSITDAIGARTLRYDGVGFLRREELPAFFGSRALAWQPDVYGRRASLGVYSQSNWPNAPTGPQFEQSYVYDPAKGRLDHISSWSGGTGYPTWRDTTYEYHPGSNLTSWTRNGWATHDVLRNLEAQRDAIESIHNYKYLPDEATTVNKLASSFVRDTLGRVEWHNLDNDWQAPDKNPLVRGYASDGHMGINYQYSGRNELMVENPWYWRNSQWYQGEGATDNQGEVRWKEYQHDNAGNPTRTRWPAHHDSLHAPNEINQLTSAYGQTLGYDADGNLTSDGTWQYTYDAENRLTRLLKNDGTQEILNDYDFQSRRVRMRAREDATSWWSKRFIYDGWNVIAEMWDSDSSALTQTNVWGIDVSGTVNGAGGIGGLLVVHASGRALLPLHDGIGNIYGYVEAGSGHTGAAWNFTAYGEVLQERGIFTDAQQQLWAGSWDFRFRYQSKYQDYVGPLVYFGYRFYHPGLGRFINRDPIGEAGGINLYAYVGSSPTNTWDYLGLDYYYLLDDGTMVIVGGRNTGSQQPPRSSGPSASWYRDYVQITRGSWDSYTDDRIYEALEQWAAQEEERRAADREDEKARYCDFLLESQFRLLDEVDQMVTGWLDAKGKATAAQGRYGAAQQAFALEIAVESFGMLLPGAAEPLLWLEETARSGMGNHYAATGVSAAKGVVSVGSFIAELPVNYAVHGRSWMNPGDVAYDARIRSARGYIANAGALLTIGATGYHYYHLIDQTDKAQWEYWENTATASRLNSEMQAKNAEINRLNAIWERECKDP